MPGRAVQRRTRLAAAAFAAITATTILSAQPAQAAPPTWPANPDWQSLVPAPTSDNVRPVAVTRTAGTVTNATALTGQSTGSTTLRTTSAAAPATIVLDFGREVGGTPTATVTASTPSSGSSTTLRITTSEALPYLTTSNGLYTATTAPPSPSPSPPPGPTPERFAAASASWPCS